MTDDSPATRSASIAELAAALAQAQGEMGAAVKDSENPFFKSRYADLASVWGACREPLAKHGLSILQPVRAAGPLVTVTTILAHSSGEWISEALTITAQQDTPQGVGSAITYGRRYGLSSMVGVAADDDDDGQLASTGPVPVAVTRAPDQPTTSRAPAPVVPGALRVTTAKVAKQGESKKGPWTLYMVKFSDGREGTTFSASLYGAAQECARIGCEVDAEFTPGGDGKSLNLTKLKPVFQVRETRAEEFEEAPF